MPDEKKKGQDFLTLFKEIKNGLAAVLKTGLTTLIDHLHCDRAAVFMLDKNAQVYVGKFTQDLTGLTALAEQITIDNSNQVLTDLLKSEKKTSPSEDGLSMWAVLKNEGEIVGLLRLENTIGRQPFNEEQNQRLQEFASHFEIIIESALLQEKNKTLADELLVVSRINNSIVRTMDLGEALEIILHNMIKHLGVDKIKLFLVDQENNLLNGKIAIDNRGTIRSIEEYKYPLKAGLNEIVDVIFSRQVDDIRQKPIINLPIKVKDEFLGVLTLDNVFSRQLLSTEDEKYLLLFVNQLATAIHNIRLAKKMEEVTIIDSLTKLYVQKYFGQRLGEEVARAKRFKQELSLLILDVDHFKVYNDTYGHPVGDTILVELAKICLHNTREVDFVARYEGDGVVMILPNTPREGSRSLAGRLRQLVESHGFVVPNGVINITITIGVSTFPGDTDDKGELTKMSEQALNWGKAHGRNQVKIFSEIF